MGRALQALCSLSFALLLPSLGCARSREPQQVDFHGVRLGMSAGDVRRRFVGPAGQWKVTPGDGMVVDYAPEGGVLPRARFEFHTGMLVAVRATLPPLDPSAEGSERVVTPASVLVRKVEGDHVAFTLLSRDCPTHRAEAAALAGVP